MIPITHRSPSLPSVFAGGEGARRLQAAGVVTDQGLLQAAAEPLYAAYSPAKTLESRR